MTHVPYAAADPRAPKQSNGWPSLLLAGALRLSPDEVTFFRCAPAHVSHGARPGCADEMPHPMRDCGLFDPPRAVPA